MEQTGRLRKQLRLRKPRRHRIAGLRVSLTHTDTMATAVPPPIEPPDSPPEEDTTEPSRSRRWRWLVGLSLLALLAVAAASAITGKIAGPEEVM